MCEALALGDVHPGTQGPRCFANEVIEQQRD
jgi:hypothetical protein